MKEDSSVTPPTPLLSRLSNATSSLGSGLAAVAGLCFATGLLIVNLHLSQYGIFNTEFVKTEYVLVGATFIFISATVIFSSRLALRLFKDIKPKIEKKEYWGSLHSAVIGLFVAIVPNLGLLNFLQNYSGRVRPTDALFFYFMLLAIYLLPKSLYKVISEHLNNTNISTLEQMTDMMRSTSNFVLPLVVIATYATKIYPSLSPAWGGGRKENVTIILTQRGLEVGKLSGLEISKDKNYVEDVKILAESDKEFTISKINRLSKNEQAIRFSRNLIEAIIEPETGNQSH